jgi:predicted hydrocarbon binding protein
MTEKTVSNMVIRVLLDSTEDVMGENGMKALLNYAKMSHLLENKPDYSTEKKYTDEEYGALTSNWYKVLGNSGGKALFRMIGKSSGKLAIQSGIFESFKELPDDEKLFKMIELFAIATGRGKALKEGDVVIYDNPQCTACVSIKDESPVCTGLNGAFDEFMVWAKIKGRRTIETKCKAMGYDTCRYEILPI